MADRPPQFFSIPKGTLTAECRSCRAVVYWITTPADRRMPVDTDVDGGAEPDAMSEGQGVSHFVTCPNANQHRKPR